MSVDTNTPSGDSKNLYEKNQDTGIQTICFTDMAERDPEIDLTGNVAGDNTMEGTALIIDTGAIRDFGSVSIPTMIVGQPTIDKNAVKAAVAKVKENMLQRSGVVSGKDYIENVIKAKIEKAKIDKENIEKDDRE